MVPIQTTADEPNPASVFVIIFLDEATVSNAASLPLVLKMSDWKCTPKVLNFNYFHRIGLVS